MARSVPMDHIWHAGPGTSYIGEASNSLGLVQAHPTIDVSESLFVHLQLCSF